MPTFYWMPVVGMLRLSQRPMCGTVPHTPGGGVDGTSPQIMVPVLLKVAISHEATIDTLKRETIRKKSENRHENGEITVDKFWETVLLSHCCVLLLGAPAGRDRHTQNRINTVYIYSIYSSLLSA